MKAKIQINNLNVFYGSNHALKDVTLTIPDKQITAFIGPSGCGKSTLLRCLNRMNDEVSKCRIQGEVLLDEEDIYNPQIDVATVRTRIGMVFQKPNPFPKSVYDNVAYGLRIHGLTNSRAQTNSMVQTALEKVGLWDEVKDDLKRNAMTLSGGQQQRLCIARAVAIQPKVLLMDEPCSALDPISTALVEELMQALAEEYCLVVVTHSMAQAQRISEQTAFFHMGALVESGKTKQIFNHPAHNRTQRYLSGKYG